MATPPGRPQLISNQTLGAHVPRRLVALLDTIARADHISCGHVVRRALVRAVEQHKRRSRRDRPRRPTTRATFDRRLPDRLSPRAKEAQDGGRATAGATAPATPGARRSRRRSRCRAVRTDRRWWRRPPRVDKVRPRRRMSPAGKPDAAAPGRASAGCRQARRRRVRRPSRAGRTASGRNRSRNSGRSRSGSPTERPRRSAVTARASAFVSCGPSLLRRAARHPSGSVRLTWRKRKQGRPLPACQNGSLRHALLLDVCKT